MISKNEFLTATKINKEIIVSEILRQVGVPAKLKGYEYLRKAILLTAHDSSLKYSMVKSVYKMIAEEHGTKAYSVERAMRNAIEVAWNRCNIEIVETLFGYTVDSTKGRPTNSEFISTICDYVSLQYPEYLDVCR